MKMLSNKQLSHRLDEIPAGKKPRSGKTSVGYQGPNADPVTAKANRKAAMAKLRSKYKK